MKKDKPSINIEDYIREAVLNAQSDRSTVEILLSRVTEYIAEAGAEGHPRFANVMSKYLESLAKSNEQMIKVVEVLARLEPPKKAKTEDLNPDAIFDALDKKDGES